MHISTAVILEMVKDGKGIAIAVKLGHAWYFDGNIYSWFRSILKFKIKVMHISATNIFEMVKNSK